MVRWVSALLVLGALACSSSTTNEGAGGGSSGGSKGGGGGSTSGGGGSAGLSGGGGSAGTTSQCSAIQCLAQLSGSACQQAWKACTGPTECETKVKDYATCSCGGASDCDLPINPAALALLNCIAKDDVLGPLCLGEKCVPQGEACTATGRGEHCCAGLNCIGNVCS